VSRSDITAEWPTLYATPANLQRFIFDYYGAERIELAPFPNAALYAKDGALLGFTNTYGYPAVTTIGDRVYLDLAPLVVSLGVAQAEMREPLAALAHEQWLGWMQWMLSKCHINDDKSVTISAEYHKALFRQMTTPYAELTEIEKAGDRLEAEKVLGLFKGATE
jgi:hypothetical protein